MAHITEEAGKSSKSIESRLRELQEKDVRDMEDIIHLVQNGYNPDSMCEFVIGGGEFKLSEITKAAIKKGADPAE